LLSLAKRLGSLRSINQFGIKKRHPRVCALQTGAMPGRFQQHQIIAAAFEMTSLPLPGVISIHITCAPQLRKAGQKGRNLSAGPHPHRSACSTTGVQAPHLQS